MFCFQIHALAYRTMNEKLGATEGTATAILTEKEWVEYVVTGANLNIVKQHRVRRSFLHSEILVCRKTQGVVITLNKNGLL